MDKRLARLTTSKSTVVFSSYFCREEMELELQSQDFKSIEKMEENLRHQKHELS